MKRIGLFFIFVNLLSISAFGQNLEIDKDGFETFEMTEGDTTYIMKKYFMVFLKKGDKRDQTAEESAQIQKGHMEHMGKLAEEGIIEMAGPFGDDGDIRGIVIFSARNEEEVRGYTSKDPAVIAGRLVMEIHPFWCAKGTTLN